MKLGRCSLAPSGVLRYGTRRADGFTIVETLIVLAVTGGLFIAIAASLAGKQNSAEFTHAIQSVQSQLQQTIDQVATGFYPNTSNFTCSSSGNTVQFSNVKSSQGTNQDCVFLGKVLQFGVQGTNPEQYQSYTIAGLRSATNGSPSPFQNVSPTILNVAGNYTGYSTSTNLAYGLSTKWMQVGGTNIGAIGFLMEPGQGNASSISGYNSGSQPVDLVPIAGTSLGLSVAQAIVPITTNLRSPGLIVNPTSGVQICFVSGGTNQSGLITIGGYGRQLLVKLDIKSNKICA